MQASSEYLSDRVVSESLLVDDHLLRALAEGVGDPVFVKDLQGRYLYINELGAQNFCATVEQVLGKADDSFFPPDEARAIAARDRAVISSGVPCTYESRHSTADGERIYLITKRPYCDPLGNVAGLVGIYREITDQKLAQEALSEATQRFHAFMDHSPIVAFMKDDRGHYVYWNAGFERAFGSPAGAAGPLADFDLFSEEVARQHRDFDREVLATNETLERIQIVPKRDGTNCPWLTCKFPIVDNSQRRFIGCVGIDMTEHERQAEQARAHIALLEAAYANLGQKQAELKLANDKLHALATTDGLTGLKNHRAFHEGLAQEHARALRGVRPLSVILLDVDHFKRYNDTHGHLAGDKALSKVARVMQAEGRTCDLIARYGGEEFAIVMPDTDGAGARAAAERLRAAIQQCQADERCITVSVGVTTLEDRDESVTNLLHQADAALYASKQAGRNRATHYGDMSQQAAA